MPHHDGAGAPVHVHRRAGAPCATAEAAEAATQAPPKVLGVKATQATKSRGHQERHALGDLLPQEARISRLHRGRAAASRAADTATATSTGSSARSTTASATAVVGTCTDTDRSRAIAVGLDDVEEEEARLQLPVPHLEHARLDAVHEAKRLQQALQEHRERHATNISGDVALDLGLDAYRNIGFARDRQQHGAHVGVANLKVVGAAGVVAGVLERLLDRGSRSLGHRGLRVERRSIRLVPTWRSGRGRDGRTGIVTAARGGTSGDQQHAEGQERRQHSRSSVVRRHRFVSPRPSIRSRRIHQYLPGVPPRTLKAMAASAILSGVARQRGGTRPYRFPYPLSSCRRARRRHRRCRC